MIFDPHLLQKYRLAFLKLRAISGSSRFFILNIVIKNEPLNVTTIVEKSGLDQPIVSQLLSVLKKGEFIESRTEKKEKIYTVNQKQVKNIIEFSSKFVQNQLEKTALNDNYTQIFKAYNVLKSLLNPGRMILIELIDKQKEISVSELVEHTNMSQSIVSQNLTILKQLGIVENTIKGRKSYYRISPETIKRNNQAISAYF